MTTDTPTQVTQNDVAAHAGVTQQTVYRVINNPALVGADTRAKVEAAITELGYTGEIVRIGRPPQAVPLVAQFSGKSDQATADLMAARSEILTATYGPNTRGYNAEIIRLALDWALRPPEGVDPMPDDYRGAVNRLPDPLPTV